MAKPITSYLWIVDGHNLVLNVPELSRLFNQESKKAAREAAESRLAEFAGHCVEGLQLVFDGQSYPEKQPGGRVEGALAVTFIDPPAEADDWIVQIARQAADAGKPVAVASSDRGLLARLPGGVMIHRMTVEAFWRETGRLLRQMSGGRAAEKPEPGAESADEMAALETSMRRPRHEEAPRGKKSDADARPARLVEEEVVEDAAPPQRSAEPPPVAPRRPEPTWQEKLTMKKEIGRRRQDRRLHRMRGR